ncbi:ornithine cyclodeaminase [Marinitenerispora sediminis]|uniref:Ornithine cyclodeaminase n=3 Tax=Marinitenerispora sediminis TaxID=1931232 RepID=A0A368T971_9ACTN|nr:ornithine cyclodeaminase [Marinitenerispora sediminis]
MTHTNQLLYLTAADVRRACEEIDPLACVREALVRHGEGRTTLPAECYLGWSPETGGEARSIAMSGLVGGEPPMVGTKLINANTANPGRGLPRASGLTVLHDVATARPVCVMDAAHVSALRTAAVSVLCALRLARPGSSAVAFVGTGAIARTHARLVAARMPEVTEIRVHDLDKERAAGFRDDLAAGFGPGGPRVVVAGDARAAVAGAGVVIPCTTTRVPYIERSWLAPGALVVNVSLDDVTEDALLAAARVYVDDWSLVVDDPHRLLGRLARAGRVGPPGAQAPPGAPPVHTLGELFTGGCPERLSDDELLVVNPFGLAIEDVVIAHRVYRVALQRGLGTPLPR